MRRQTVSALALTVLLVASTVAATAPAVATTATPADASAAATPAAGAADGSTDRTYNDTAFLALADAGGGAVVAGGQTGLRNSNATLMRVGADGKPEWTTRIESPNATRVVDVSVSGGGDVYFLLSSAPRSPSSGPRAGTLQIGRATEDGDVIWRTSLDGVAGYGPAASVVASDDGAVVAHSLPTASGVRIAEYAGGDAVWERTHGVDGAPTALRATDDGYLLAGTESFGTPWVIRTTMSGRERLNATLSGVEAQQVVGAVPTDDGGVLLAGWRTPSYSGYSSSGWAARVDGDGLTRWSRVYGAGSDLRVRDAFARDDGLVLLGQSRSSVSGDGTTRLVGVGADGAELFDEEVEGLPWITAAARTGGSIRIAGVTGLGRRGFDGTLRSVAVPEPSGDAETISADVGPTSNGTVYMGQNLRFAGADASGETFDLVRLPDGDDEFDAHVVRRIELGADGEAVVESATLAPGDYVLRTADGRNLTLADGRITGLADADDPAAFTVRAQDFYHVRTNRTFVDVAAGERGVSMRLTSDRANYDVYVSADRYEGDAATAAELRGAFGDLPGFEGIERVNGRPAARVSVGENPWINGSVAAFGAGLYEVTVASVDTRDAGAVATTRVVVGNASGSRLGLELGTRNLTVPVGGETETNVTLTNVTHGVAAMSMSANLTGEPTVGLRLDVSINASRASGSAGWGGDEATAGAAAFGGNTGNGTVTVGTFGASADAWAVDANATGTNAATLRIDWVVDERGVPYSVPGNVTVPIEVVPAENATGGGGAGTGGSSSGGSSSGGSASGSESASGGGSSSGAEKAA